MFIPIKTFKNELNKWSYSDMPTIIVNLMAMSGKVQSCVMNQGITGTSKSRCSSELARMLKLAGDKQDEFGCFVDPVVVFNGRLTSRGLFDFIKRHQHKTIIFDDMTCLSREQKGLIKDACGESHTVVWATQVGSESVAVDQFIFSGSIIINTNINPNKSDMDLDAIKSRAFVSNFIYNPSILEEKRTRLWSQAQGKSLIDMDTWRIIRKQLLDMKIGELTKAEFAKIYYFVNTVAITYATEYSIRDDILAIKLAKWLKSFFGSFTDEVFELYTDVLKKFYVDGAGKEESDVVSVMNAIMKQSQGAIVRRKELVAGLMKERGIKKSKAYEKISDAVFARQIMDTGDGKGAFFLPKLQNYIAPTIVQEF